VSSTSQLCTAVLACMCTALAPHALHMVVHKRCDAHGNSSKAALTRVQQALGSALFFSTLCCGIWLPASCAACCHALQHMLCAPCRRLPAGRRQQAAPAWQVGACFTDAMTCELLTPISVISFTARFATGALAWHKQPSRTPTTSVDLSIAACTSWPAVHVPTAAPAHAVVLCVHSTARSLRLQR
jgi:hypothetical protein